MMKLIFTIVTVIIFQCSYAQYLETGRKQLANERYASAIKTYQDGLQKDPANGQAWLQLTKAYYLDKQFDKASDTLQLAPVEIKTDPYYRIALSKTLLQAGKKDEALSIFGEISGMSKKKVKPFLQEIAEVHITTQNGNVQTGIDMINELVKKDKKNSELYLLLGDAYRKLSNGTEAFKAFQKAADEDEYKAEALYKMGEIFLTQKNVEVYTDYFKQSLATDSTFAPALYSMYVYSLYRNPANAMKYYDSYVRHSDPSSQRAYDLADLFYLNKQYGLAIDKADQLINRDKENVQPRIYKLKAYSYTEMKDSVKALTEMTNYFAKEADTNIIAQDYLTMSQLYQSQKGHDSLAAEYLAKAIPLEKDSANIYAYYKTIADIAKDRKDFPTQAKWLEKFYLGNSKASNVDLFYWGLAHYRSENFTQADSVFGLYVNKYPEQSFGYYWQAKSKALQDKDMETGLAIPTYQKLVEVLQKDTADTNYKTWMVEAYGYLAAYEANNQKDYTEAIDYFEKVLEIDPGNETATKYIEVLEKREEVSINK